MATLPPQQHVCNRSSSSGTDSNLILFRNDANNVNALQRARLQKKLAEEAAHRQKEQLDVAAKSLAAEVEDKEKIQKERDTLGNEARSLELKISEMEERLPYMNPQNNCLPFQYHGSTVLIINLTSQLALDTNNEEYGTRICGWEADIFNWGQIFNLSKVCGYSDPNDSWTIARKEDGQRLYVPYGDFTEPLLGTASGKQECWYIGRGSASRVGTWVIENAEWGTVLEQPDARRSNGCPIVSSPRSDNDAANWIIIPISFTR